MSSVVINSYSIFNFLKLRGGRVPFISSNLINSQWDLMESDDNEE
jgi:hypothetical protein